MGVTCTAFLLCRQRIKGWQGLAHVVIILLAVALARFAVFDVVQWAVMGRPHEGMLLGALLIVGAAALLPLVLVCYSQNQVSGCEVVLEGGTVIYGSLLVAGLEAQLAGSQI
jgi:hypothetical protein